MINIRSATFICSSFLFAAMTCPASAISVEVAKKCDELVAKAFPSREPDNPAAGSAKGSGFAVQAYFKKCVANGGRAPDDDPKRPK